jgi:hypothetical protein
LDDQDNIKLGDFGTATNLLFTGQNFINFAGTPLYVSPEIINGIPYSYKADIWALGVVCYELLTGRPPFFDTNFSGLLTKICCQNPEPICSNYSEDLVEFTFWLLRKNHEQRPTIAQIFKHDFILTNLEQFADEKEQLVSMTTLPDFKLTEGQLQKEFKSMKTLRYSEFFEKDSNHSRAKSPEKKPLELIDIIGSSLFFRNGGEKGIESKVSIEDLDNFESFVFEDQGHDKDEEFKQFNEDGVPERRSEFITLFANSALSKDNFKLGDLSQLLKQTNNSNIHRAPNNSHHTGSNYIFGSHFSDDSSVNLSNGGSHVNENKTKTVEAKTTDIGTESKFKNFNPHTQKLVRSQFDQKEQEKNLRGQKLKGPSSFKPKQLGTNIKSEKVVEKHPKLSLISQHATPKKPKVETEAKELKNSFAFSSNTRLTKNTVKNELQAKLLTPSQQLKNSMTTDKNATPKQPVEKMKSTKMVYLSPKVKNLESNSVTLSKNLTKSTATAKKLSKNNLANDIGFSTPQSDNKTVKHQRTKTSGLTSKPNISSFAPQKMLKSKIKSLSTSVEDAFMESLNVEIRKFILNYGFLEVETLLQDKKNLKGIFEATGHGGFQSENELELLYGAVKTNLESIKTQFLGLKA